MRNQVPLLILLLAVAALVTQWAPGPAQGPGGDPPEVFYYTEDHYRSFRAIEGRP